MKYEQWMHLVVFFFWTMTILACIRAIFRGRVFAISLFYLQLFICLILSMALVEEIIGSSQKTGELNYIPIFSLLLFSIIILISFFTQRKQYLFWGIEEKLFVEAFQNLLRKIKLEYKEENNKIILSNTPGDTYQYHSLNMKKAGTVMTITRKGKGKTDQEKLVSKVKDALSSYSMSLWSKILLIPMILLSCFMLYIYFLVIH